MINRTFVMGDIHGAYRALMQCLERSGFDYENDQLIFLGDVCDGWSETHLAVEELLKIQNLIKILGNHDDWFKEFINFRFHPANWEYGGQATLNSYYVPEKVEGLFINVPQTHRNFFNTMQLYHIDDKNRMFCHAGWTHTSSVKDIEALKPTDFYWNRELWKKAMSCSKDDKLNHVDNFDEIYIGHTPTINWEATGRFKYLRDNSEPNLVRINKPMYSGGIWNVDTGCGFGPQGGKLTIMNVDTKEYWQSDLVKDLYPTRKRQIIVIFVEI